MTVRETVSVFFPSQFLPTVPPLILLETEQTKNLTIESGKYKNTETPINACIQLYFITLKVSFMGPER